jgi:hypothetical protein
MALSAVTAGMYASPDGQIPNAAYTEFKKCDKKSRMLKQCGWCDLLG